MSWNPYNNIDKTFQEIFQLFSMWISWAGIQERKESSVGSCGLGNQILYIFCLWVPRKNHLITFRNKNEFSSFHLSGRKQKLPVNFCNYPDHSFNRTFNKIIAILLNQELHIYYSLSITYINIFINNSSDLGKGCVTLSQSTNKSL